MAGPWHQQQQPHQQPDVGWAPTPASAFQVASAPGALPQRQRIGQLQQQQPPSSWPGAAAASPSPSPPPLPLLFLGPSAAAAGLSPHPPPGAPPSQHHHYVENRGTGEFRRLRPWELPALALAQAAAGGGGEAAAVAELLRLQQQRQAARSRSRACCLWFGRGERDGQEEEEDDKDDDDDVRVSNLPGGPSPAALLLLASAARASTRATTPCDARAALAATIIPLAALVQGLSAGAAAAAAAAAYGQAHARAASLDAENPEVWALALIDAFGSGAGVRFGRGLLGLSALSAVLAAAAAGLTLPSASAFLGVAGGGEGGRRRRTHNPSPRSRAWPAAALLFAAAHLMGLVAATPAEDDLAARPRPRLVPLLWHAATVARCLLFAGGWLAACWALGERVLAGERAARRGRAAAWRASVLARALAFGGGGGS